MTQRHEPQLIESCGFLLSGLFWRFGQGAARLASFQLRCVTGTPTCSDCLPLGVWWQFSTDTLELTMTPSVTLTFQNTAIDLLEIDGEQWARGLQIATALGFKNPAQDFKNLYSRNESEFTERMTRVIELPTAGGLQQVRVFTLRGAHLLGMLARTEIAKTFRHWILDVLDGFVAPQQSGRMTFPQRLGFLKFRTQLVKELGRCDNLGEANELFMNLRDVTRLLGMHLVSTLEQLAPGLKQARLPEGGAA